MTTLDQLTHAAAAELAAQIPGGAVIVIAATPHEYHWAWRGASVIAQGALTRASADIGASLFSPAANDGAGGARH